MRRTGYETRTVWTVACLLGSVFLLHLGHAAAEEPSGSFSGGPVVLGHGVGLFKIGAVLVEDPFDNLDNWVVQIQDRTGNPAPKVEVRDHSLDCFLPGTGCTVWFKKELATRIAITYEVICPTHSPEIPGVVARDLNQFWMCSDPEDPSAGLFDSERYTGAFKSYNKMRGYYASTGGRNNQTTRMRRYPREQGGRAVDHLALNDKDGGIGYLITPDKVMHVQLVAYDDVIQYIVDGKLVYQIGRGDRVTLEGRGEGGRTLMKDGVYQTDHFPVYTKGFFGFRMVSTHHVYRNFKVHSLEPETEGAGRRPTVHVSSIAELRSAVAKSRQQITLAPGTYHVADPGGIQLTGSDNDLNLTGTVIKVQLKEASGSNLFRLEGDRNTIRGGEIEDVYPDGRTEVDDYGAYNHRREFGGMNEMVIPGDDNRVVGVKMTVRGSYPYGYGNLFGIGRGSVLRLKKHCGIQITGDRALIDSCRVKMEAFGHAIYVQGGDRTTVRGTVVEGTLRPSNDCYAETDERDLAKRYGYQLQWPEEVRGLPIPRDHMINCTEDGIRAYKGAGQMLVDDCVVKACRGGIKLYMAKGARVTNCKVLDCVVQGYSLPSRGAIEASEGNAAYGPLLYVHSDSHSKQHVDLKVLPAPHSLGDHPLAAIKGKGHEITFTAADGGASESLRPIIVGYPMRFDFLSVDYPDVPPGYEAKFQEYSPDTYVASGITLENQTVHPVVLGKSSEANTVRSVGPVEDLGRNRVLSGDSDPN